MLENAQLKELPMEIPANRRILTFLDRALRALAWGAVAVIAVLSLLPSKQMARTSLGGHIEHVLAYAGTTFLLVLAYRDRSKLVPCAGMLMYAAALEYFQQFSPGRASQFGDFAFSSAGIICGLVFARAVFLRELSVGDRLSR
jgi:VanZ family protein